MTYSEQGVEEGGKRRMDGQMDSPWRFFKVCDLICQIFQAFIPNPYWYLEERSILSTVRLGVDRHLKTTCWPSFGISALCFRVESPETTRTASRLLRMRTSHRFLVPQNFLHPGVSAAANRKSHISVIPGTQVSRGSSDPKLPPAAPLLFQEPKIPKTWFSWNRAVILSGAGKAWRGRVGAHLEDLLSLVATSYPVSVYPFVSLTIMMGMSHIHHVCRLDKKCLTFKSPSITINVSSPL